MVANRAREFLFCQLDFSRRSSVAYIASTRHAQTRTPHQVPRPPTYLVQRQTQRSRAAPRRRGTRLLRPHGAPAGPRPTGAPTHGDLRCGDRGRDMRAFPGRDSSRFRALLDAYAAARRRAGRAAQWVSCALAGAAGRLLSASTYVCGFARNGGYVENLGLRGASGGKQDVRRGRCGE
ncbi:hypothetical protein HYPSUDRAFT_1044568 [Hypholoma sublateritium FD-334 SS-4]|uniref:Uncharacterized protein n=1 Tax=Hypholoma sublateritium (strain FD-334 SS-4) TaxID=945553 RepID=A0A0D2NKN3_HYPSF|nr:hypothetical protein HYPSUDRAFT_1044568 [Hypholoma sublateritium FD-334 SS-4]